MTGKRQIKKFSPGGGLAWAMLVGSLLIGGCATQQGQQPADPAPPVSRPEPPAGRAPVHALSRMLDESRAQVEARNWEAAIVTAERGLRIDRREPEFYFLLAQSYWGLAEIPRARQFARQGLRHVEDPTSPIATELQDLLRFLEGY